MTARRHVYVASLLQTSSQRTLELCLCFRSSRRLPCRHFRLSKCGPPCIDAGAKSDKRKGRNCGRFESGELATPDSDECEANSSRNETEQDTRDNVVFGENGERKERGGNKEIRDPTQ